MHSYAQVLKYVRTAYGKAIRKKYKSGILNERRCNMRQLVPRTDGIANTLTTVLKDNYLIECVEKIRKEGNIIENNQSNTLNSKGYELINFCEFDQFAAKSYCAVHGVDPSLNLGDITKVDENNLKPFNMICGGSPCFVEGTMVLTDNGYVPIENIEVGNKVVTHKNRLRDVKKTMTSVTNSLIGVYGSPSEFIYCTPEHPFYIRKHHRKWDNERNGYKREFDEPKWVEAKDLCVNDYVGTPVNQIEEMPTWNGYDYYENQYKKTLIHKNELTGLFERNDFWYIVGRYIGDGWLKSNDENSVIICSNDEEVGQITNRLERLNLHYSLAQQKTTVRIQIVKKELYLYLKQFGHGAVNKHLTKDILNLPIDKLNSFLDGYIDSDGCFTQGKYKISSVSRRLIYEVGQCVAKVYKRPFSIYFTLRPKTSVIEGRIVNQKDTYLVCWKPDDSKQDHSFYEDGYIWSPITKLKQEESQELVYNIEVDEDNSYVVQNITVHNCQDFSVAGKQAGAKWKCADCKHEYNPLTVHYSKRNQCPNCGGENLDKTRSSLLVEWLRVIRANKPKWGIYENVKNIVGKQFKEMFQMFLDELHEYGYNTYFKVLNAKDFGIPQNRERVYLIIILKEYDNGKFKFPEPFDNGIRLKDILEDEVDEKYYINTQQAKALIDDLVESGRLDKDVSNTVRTGGRGSTDRHQWDMVQI